MTDRPLWQLVLARFEDRDTHPLDQERMVSALKGMWMVGERPSLEEIKAYTSELWGEDAPVRPSVVDTWRTILKQPHRKFRALRPRRGHEPLYVVDFVAEEYGLEPTEARLGRVLVAAAERVAVAQGGPLDDLLAARQDLEAASSAVYRLQRLRLGSRALGENVDDPALRPRWW